MERRAVALLYGCGIPAAEWLDLSAVHWHCAARTCSCQQPSPFSAVRRGDAALPKLLWEDLLFILF